MGHALPGNKQTRLSTRPRQVLAYRVKWFLFLLSMIG